MDAKRAIVGLLLAAAVAGCGSTPKAQPLQPEAFVSPAPSPAPSDRQPAQPLVRVPADTPLNPAPKPPPLPATLPGPTSGQFFVVGGVVALVNDAPIYANKVMQLLEDPFREKAKQLDKAQFRTFAQDRIRATIQELIRNEIVYAAAQRYLDEEDKKQAEVMTMMWRNKRITEAGGSVEQVRAKFAQDGIEFEQAVADQARAELVQLYYQKRVYPRIQVSADDIRAYYAQNRDREFTQHEAVKFHLLKVDWKATGGKEKALDKVTDKYKRARAGENFVQMVQRENDEKMFAGEKPLDYKIGSFVIDEVEKALLKLKPGEFTEPVEARQAYYLAQLVDRTAGKIRPFDDSEVQETIRRKLRAEQFRVLQDQMYARLIRDAVVRMDEQTIAIALDMAMQKYALYSAK